MSRPAIRAFARLLLGLFVLLCTPTAAWAQGKIAVIDLRRAVFDTEDGLRVQAKLQQLLDARQNDFEAKKKTYDDAQAELERLAKEGKTSDAELRKKYAAFEKLAIDLQTTQMKYKAEVQRQENDLVTPIIKQMMSMVRRLASQNGYDMVLAKEAVPYARQDLDITDRIIQMYNAQTTSPDEKAPPSKKGGKGGKEAPAPKPKQEPKK
jgi:outer membrane protein